MLKATALSLILLCQGLLQLTNMTTVLIPMAKTPIFIIGADTLLL